MNEPSVRVVLHRITLAKLIRNLIIAVALFALGLAESQGALAIINSSFATNDVFNTNDGLSDSLIGSRTNRFTYVPDIPFASDSANVTFVINDFEAAQASSVDSLLIPSAYFSEPICSYVDFAINVSEPSTFLIPNQRHLYTTLREHHTKSPGAHNGGLVSRFSSTPQPINALLVCCVLLTGVPRFTIGNTGVRKLLSDLSVSDSQSLVLRYRPSMRSLDPSTRERR